MHTTSPLSVSQAESGVREDLSTEAGHVRRLNTCGGLPTALCSPTNWGTTIEII